MPESVSISELASIRSILEAASFAAEQHAGQKRKGASAEPYVNHVLDVAHLAATAIPEPDTNLIIAALLHDVVEDTAVTKQGVAEEFGTDVADLVMELTDDKSLPKQERKRLQVVHAPTLSARAQVIKLADKISNFRSILISPPADWSVERRKEYVEWGKQVVDGLTTPNPILKAEFDSLYRTFHEQPAYLQP